VSENKKFLSELNTIANSKALNIIIAAHRIIITNKIIKFVREKDLMSAYGEVCKLDDSNRILKLVQQEIENIKQEGEK